MTLPDKKKKSPFNDILGDLRKKTSDEKEKVAEPPGPQKTDSGTESDSYIDSDSDIEIGTDSGLDSGTDSGQDESLNTNDNTAFNKRFLQNRDAEDRQLKYYGARFEQWQIEEMKKYADKLNMNVGEFWRETIKMALDIYEGRID